MLHMFRFHGTRLGNLHWELTDDEWFHITKVLRLASGAEVEIVDGLGWLAHAHLDSKGKSTGELVISSEEYNDAPDGNNHLAVAIGALRPQSVEDFLPSLIELGVDEIIVFASDGIDPARMSEKVKERWSRIIVSSCKQCKRLWFPQIMWLSNLDLLTSDALVGRYSTRLVLDPGATQSLKCVANELYSNSAICVIGSEKGFSKLELEKFQKARFLPVKLGNNVLRSITASVAAVAILGNR